MASNPPKPQPKQQPGKSDPRRFVDSEVDGIRITPPPKKTPKT